MTPARHRQVRHRRVRPRFGRIAVAGVSSVVTVVAMLGGLGLMPSLGADGSAQAAALPRPPSRPPSGALRQAAYLAPTPSGTDGVKTQGADATGPPDTSDSPDASHSPDTSPTVTVDPALPADSGTGHRVVFSESLQRVWLVSGRRKVKRTYLVSGSLYDNLDPGTYEVYSRSQQAWGIEDSGTMGYFVRFAHGTRAAIGFHDIPVSEGRPVQSVAELGTPTSHGCIRQRRADARVLWQFAPVGTTVVVTA